MNTLRTVFAFVVLVCAIAFAAAAYVLVKNTEDFKGKWTEEQKAHKTDVEKYTKEKNDLQIALDAAKAESKKYQGEYDKVVLDLGSKQAELLAAKKDLDAAQADVKRLGDAVAEIKKLQETQNAAIATLTKEKEALSAAKDAAEGAQRTAEDKLKTANDDIVNLQKALKLTTSQLDDSKGLNERYAKVYGEDGKRLAEAAPALPPVINGVIKSADNPQRLVSISVGKDDGVKAGMTFEVVRTATSEYIGRVQVREVRDTESICRIDTAMTDARTIAEGDHVTTRIK